MPALSSQPVKLCAVATSSKLRMDSLKAMRAGEVSSFSLLEVVAVMDDSWAARAVKQSKVSEVELHDATVKDVC